ncbi:DUF6191 domain-containing protein [Streptomyces sp. NPDC059849]|uniref:DUF6191 domain-containing protein n=1 Tax=Streptomyces sp. NPDC059849 TaxID=3346969 RepID=UPI0036462217
MFNFFEELFAPGRKHTSDEQKRLELTRVDLGVGDPGRGPIDLTSGKVVVRASVAGDSTSANAVADQTDQADGTGQAARTDQEDGTDQEDQADEADQGSAQDVETDGDGDVEADGDGGRGGARA